MSSRLATLAIALAAAGGALGQQSESTTIDAQKIEGVSDLEVSARGSAEIRRGEVTVFGEFLRYNREFGELEGTGGVPLQSGVDRFFGPTLEYHPLEDTGTFEKPGFLLQRERPARGSADRMEFLGPNHYRFLNARFTTCQPGRTIGFSRRASSSSTTTPTRARREATAPSFLRPHGARVPVCPRFHSRTGRRSGLLTPYYSQTNTRGLEFGIPYYWNIAPERDATFTPVLHGAARLPAEKRLALSRAPVRGRISLRVSAARSGVREHAQRPLVAARADLPARSDRQRGLQQGLGRPLFSSISRAR